jgi:hypothetical protein
MEDLRPDCRRFHCCRCQRVVYVCSHCDRGQRYCSETCRARARRATLRAAGARYQRTLRGRANHARRQSEYRRRRAAAKKVTHHGCRRLQASGSVVPCAREQAVQVVQRLQAPGGEQLRCFVCGHGCEPWVRWDFLRCRRPVVHRPPLQTARVSETEAGNDLRGADGRDPSPV